MSQPSSANTARKRHFDVYTMMLVLAFLAIVIGCVMLYMELTLFGEYPWWDTSAANVSVSQAAPEALDLAASSRPWA